MHVAHETNELNAELILLYMNAKHKLKVNENRMTGTRTAKSNG